MSEANLKRARAAVVAIAPVVLLIGFIWLPYVNDFTDETKVAEAVADSPNRWAWASIILTVAIGLSLTSAVAIRMFLRDAGEQMWSPIAVLLILVGGALVLAWNPGLAFVWAHNGQISVSEMVTASQDWLVLGIVASVIFGLGFLSLALAVYRSRILPREWSWLVAAAYVVMVVMVFIPMGWATYALAVAAIVASWPIAYRMWGGELMRMPMGAARPGAARA